MSRRFFISAHHLVLFFSALLPCFCANLLGAVFTLSPVTISNSYTGNISFLINNVVSGANVRIEEFIDLNKNGIVDSTDLLVTSFQVTDGQLTTFGGVADPNIPGDQDAVAGQITTSLSFPNSPEGSRVDGAHLFRLSSPTGAFASVVQPFTVTQFSYSQSVTGIVTSGGSPVASAFVGLLTPVGSDTVFVGGTLTDASGKYALPLPAGTYYMFTFKAGLISGFGSPQITVNTNQTLVQNLTMAPTTETISGTVKDALTGVGLPGLQVLLQSTTTNTGTLGFTDANGNFNLPVTADTYKVDFSDKGLEFLGYLRPSSKPRINATTGSVTGLALTLTKETALIYGSLKTSANQPLSGVSISANDSQSLYNSSASTDSSGNYSLGVLGGAVWYLGPDNSNPLLSGYSVQGTNVTLAANQAVKVDFVAQHLTAHLIGHVTDNTGTPQAGVTLMAVIPNTSGSSPQATTAADGSFDIGVYGGTWDLMVNFNGTAYNWMSPVLSFNVTDGVDISNIAFVVQKATASVTGWLHDPQGVPVANANISAFGTVNGTNYNNVVTTDASGNYQLPVANGSWQIGVGDCLGYGCPTNNFQTVAINGVNVVVDFLFVGPAQLSLYFRHFIYGGDFGTGVTPATAYPLSIFQYVAILTAQNATAYPPAGAVFFTGPAGSGLIGNPATDAVPGNNSMIYFSPAVASPPIAPGGSWTIGYNGAITNLNIPDPQAAARLFAVIPSATVSGGLLTSVSWVYKDTNGVLLAAAPQFVTKVQVQIFDQDLNGLDASPLSTPTTTSYALVQALPWSSIGRIRAIYFDTLGNRYFLNFNRAIPSLARAAMLGNNQFGFQVTGLIFQNYTIEYSTTLTNWNTLYVTNAPASLFNVVVPNATGGYKFYRILGP